MSFVTYFNFLIIFFFSLIWIGLILFFSQRLKNNIKFLILFTIFYFYIYKVLDYTLIQFQSLILLKYFMPNLLLKGETVGESINLIPLVRLRLEDIKTSLLNILLFVPYGFGLPFISKFNMKRIIIWGSLFSILIEFLQLITGLISGVSFRITDINDLIFNTFGVFVGYVLFVGFKRIFKYLI